MIDVRIDGVPVPQGSKTAFVVGKDRPRAVVVDVKKDSLRAWRDQVAAVVKAAGWSVVGHVPVRVDLAFFLPRGKTVSRVFPTTKPDVDKLTRAVFDALTESGVIADDSQIVTATQTKKYADGVPVGVRIRVMEEKE